MTDPILTYKKINQPTGPITSIELYEDGRVEVIERGKQLKELQLSPEEVASYADRLVKAGFLGFKDEYHSRGLMVLDGLEQVLTLNYQGSSKEVKCRDELIKKRHELNKVKIDEESEQDYKTALFHLSNLIKFPTEYRDMQRDVELKGKVDVYIERDPLKILQMGNYFSDSCLAISKMNGWSTIANAIDANDAVVYVKYDGEIVGRKLLKLDNDGKILQHRAYSNNMSLNMDLLTNMFVKNLARVMKTEVGEGNNFKDRLVADHWYNDGQKTLQYFFMQKAS
ncbi:hypothetical protein KY343_04280 [Candidatus Woesearchaeota archaeon]|nr:hypothetical protein [Candidatus Woesearchaeota archaeon]